MDSINQSKLNSLPLYLGPIAPLLKFWKWSNQRGYTQGVFWAILVCLISSLNDVFTRLAGTRLESLQVAFLRLFFMTLTLLPVMLYFNRSAFKTKRPGFHIARALLGYGAIAAWCAGVAATPLVIACTIAQTVPLFVLPMAFVVLGEKIGWQRTLATVAGFIGIMIVLQPNASDSQFSFMNFNIGALWLLGAAILFAASDILNKIMVSKESDLTMLFYFAAGTACIGAAPAYMVWQMPSFMEVLWLLCLGAGANLILYCLLKAFAATEISALQPYRYVELFFASGFGFILFGELIGLMALIGAAIIIFSTLTIAYYETHLRRKDAKMNKGTASLQSKAKIKQKLVA
ncbi:MAG: DMT family transporter [Alphaproteobacteria bacterium]|nr:DMT family transporter [Alphaproteobacteria bacterium]